MYEFLMFKRPVLYRALKRAVIEYVRKCEYFVSNLMFEETCAATSNEAAKTMCNDVKEI